MEKKINYSIDRYLDFNFVQLVSENELKEIFAYLYEQEIGIEPNPLSQLYFTDWKYETEYENGYNLLNKYIETEDNSILNELHNYVITANYINLGDELPLNAFAHLYLNEKKKKNNV